MNGYPYLCGWENRPRITPQKRNIKERFHTLFFFRERQAKQQEPSRRLSRCRTTAKCYHNRGTAEAGQPRDAGDVSALEYYMGE